jgi:8-oxo-dGTP pyrophosphatase MutT (NUDIX family)
MENKELHRIQTTTLIYRKRGVDFEYLITKRAPHKKVHPNKWHIPGGGLETDDYVKTRPHYKNPDQWYGALNNSLIREIREEVGLKIGKPELLVDITFIRPDGIPSIIFSYFAKFISGKVRLDEDTTDFKWVTVKEAKKYDLIDGIWGEIRDVEKILKTRKIK